MKIFKAVVAAAVAVALALGVFYFFYEVRPFTHSPFKQVDDSYYRDCLELVREAKSPLFETKLGNLVDSGKDEEDMVEYEEQYYQKFNALLEARGDYTEEERLFAQCSWGVWYTEYMAKWYELRTDGVLLDSVYGGNNELWRRYADNSYDMLREAKTTDELKMIIDYLAQRNIVTFD